MTAIRWALRGRFTIPAGAMDYTVTDPGILKACTVATAMPMDINSAGNDLATEIEDGSVKFRLRGRPVGYCALEMDEREIPLIRDVPIKITNYDDILVNHPFSVDNPNGLWTPLYVAIYQVFLEIAFEAPNNSTFNFYLARNEDLQDALVNTVSIQGNAQSMVSSFSEVALGWAAGDSMSFWVELASASDTITFYDISLLTQQMELLEQQPAALDTHWSYVIF